MTHAPSYLTGLILRSTADSHCNCGELPPQLIGPEAEPETRAREVIPGCRNEGVDR